MLVSRVGQRVALLVTGSVALVALVAGPALAGPSITVTPSTGLHGGQVVTVSVNGFPANASLAVIQCSPLVATAGPSACNTGGVKLVSTGANGTATTTLAVVTGAVGTAPGSTCPGAGGACVVSAAQVTSQSVNASATIMFASAPATVPGATTTQTGRPVLTEVAGAAVLVLAGAGLVTAARRRRPARSR